MPDMGMFMHKSSSNFDCIKILVFTCTKYFMLFQYLLIFIWYLLNNIKGPVPLKAQICPFIVSFLDCKQINTDLIFITYNTFMIRRETNIIFNIYE